MSKAKLVTAILISASSLLAIIANAVKIMFTIEKVSLYRVRFYTLINLCMANIVTLQIVSSGVIYLLLEGCAVEEDMVNVVWSTGGTATTIAHINSLLTTAFLSTDRYIAVKYGIYYQNVLKLPRMFYDLVSLWVLSIIVTRIQWSGGQNYLKRGIGFLVKYIKVHKQH